MSTKQNNYKQFIEVSFSGRQLLKKYSLDETGTWEIVGEDTNCDWGGHHHQPELGMVEGRLGDIIAYAVELAGFWTWGCGGDIRKIGKPIKITAESNAERVRLQEQAARLREELKQVEQQLKAM
jgi:hypothetical protein